jgi:hypothetical protein
MKTNKTKNTIQKHKRLPVQMPEKPKHRMKTNKKRTQHRNLKDYQYRCKKKQNTE